MDKQTQNQIDESLGETLAYIAGFLDGEGSFMIMKAQSRRGGQNGYRYKIQVRVTNTDKKPLDLIKKTFHLSCHFYKVPQKKFLKDKTRQYKTKYELTFQDQQAKKVLLALQPYLITKAKQAKVCLKLQERIDKGKIERGRQLAMGKILPISETEWTARQKLYEKAKRLNQKGEKINANAKRQTIH